MNMESIEASINRIGFGNSHYFREMGAPKLEEIKKLLDNKGDTEKLEGMKRLIASISKGRDVSALFPDVVKNVVCQSLEVKKLVYIYLVHYAESQSETALLAIATFQKDLKDKNQLIRALALRVMSSIRVRIITSVVVLAIKGASRDTSPYVRKTAAHAIPKVYSLDHDQKEVLIEIIQDLLNDKSTIVLGSAIAAFSEVCPERIDLLHPHFRKLCNLLADIDEWGQIVLLNILLRYGRTQFLKADAEEEKAPKKRTKKKSKNDSFYSDSESESGESSAEEAEDLYKDEVEMDPDHRLLIRCSQSLLQSRNNGVVMAVAALYYYLAPKMEAQRVGKSLVRILRNPREVQYVVLSNIATLASTRPNMFTNNLQEFFVNSTDPSYCRELKLEILTYVATESNIQKILREFNSYVHREEKQFVAQTIQAIGRCAIQIPEVMDSCMHGLMALINSKSETVIAESVVVIKTLLQIGSSERNGIISHLAKLLDSITVPEARASIIWVVGEYCEKIPLLAPDILRKLAKSFPDEETIVKLQILNLASKLLLINPDQTSLIVQYVLNMARFDMNYDIRDRARIMKQILLGKAGTLQQHAKTLFTNKKPAPSVKSPSEDRLRFALGSLSHIVKHTAFGYQPIPDHPTVAPNPDVRNPIVPKIEESFYKENKSGSDEDDFYGKEDNERNRSDRSYSDEEDRSDRSYSDRSYSDRSYSDDSYSDRSYDSYSDKSDRSDSGSDYSSEEDNRRSRSKKNTKPSKDSKQKKVTVPVTVQQPQKPAQSFDDFMNLGAIPVASKGPSSSSSSASSLDSFLSSDSFSSSNSSLVPEAIHLPKSNLLSSVAGGGLSVEYTFLRKLSLYGEAFSMIQLTLRNASQSLLGSIRIGKTDLGAKMTLHPFSEIHSLSPGAACDAIIHINFVSVTQPAKFEICHDGGRYSVSLAPQVGELVRGTTMTPTDFASTQKKLGGMNESSVAINLSSVKSQLPLIPQRVLESAYVSPVSVDTTTGLFRFAGYTLNGKLPVLVTVEVDVNNGVGKCKVNCENTIYGSMLANNCRASIQKA